jgi:hypothetical protein
MGSEFEFICCYVELFESTLSTLCCIALRVYCFTFVSLLLTLSYFFVPVLGENVNKLTRNCDDSVNVIKLWWEWEYYQILMTVWTSSDCDVSVNVIKLWWQCERNQTVMTVWTLSNFDDSLNVIKLRWQCERHQIVMTVWTSPNCDDRVIVAKLTVNLFHKSWKPARKELKIADRTLCCKCS